MPSWVPSRLSLRFATREFHCTVADPYRDQLLPGSFHMWMKALALPIERTQCANSLGTSIRAMGAL
jgi:hypothetical protein